MVHKINLQLQERGKFIITVDDEQQYHGKFGMMALESFMKIKNIPGIFVLGETFRMGFMPSDYARLVICGIDMLDKHHKLTDADVMEWFDVMGGTNSNDFCKLMAQAMKTFSTVSGDGLTLNEEEKKILGIAIASNSSDTSVSKPVLKRKSTTKAH
jgi:hypothetical protein